MTWSAEQELNAFGVVGFSLDSFGYEAADRLEMVWGERGLVTKRRATAYTLYVEEVDWQERARREMGIATTETA